MQTIEYTIGDRKFYQRPLSNLQQVMVEQLIFDLVKDGLIQISDGPSLFKTLGAHRGKLMAYVLIPIEFDARSFVKAADQPGFLDGNEAFFDDEADPGTRYKVIMDFFVCNQIGLGIESGTNLMSWITAKEEMTSTSGLENGSNGSAPLLPEETLRTEMPSMP